MIEWRRVPGAHGDWREADFGHWGIAVRHRRSGWCLSCYVLSMGNVQLVSKTLPEAKKEAVERVRGRLAQMMKDLEA